MTNLQAFIEQTPLVDSHEHQLSEPQWLNDGPDIMGALFGHYVAADLAVAGADAEAIEHIGDTSRSIAERFGTIEQAWAHCRHTGYGEGVLLAARHVYGIEHIDAASLEAAEPRHKALRQPGERLRLMRDMANLDHAQIDNFAARCAPDESGPDFFFYDLAWPSFSDASFDVPALEKETGVAVRDIDSLDEAMTKMFAMYGDLAIAMKTQHAYSRTLMWQKRDRAAVEAALQAKLTDKGFDEAAALCLGDWCLERGVVLASQYNLPIKIHTGYLAGHNRMQLDQVRPANLCGLLLAHPEARFVFMHCSYPYGNELAALAKQFTNLYADLCWAWAMDPMSTALLVRKFIHAAPANRLFAFGGDTTWPPMAVAYAIQARRWLGWALQREIDDGLLDESAAIALAERFMRRNQYDCFDVAGCREAIERSVAAG